MAVFVSTLPPLLPIVSPLIEISLATKRRLFNDTSPFNIIFPKRVKFPFTDKSLPIESREFIETSPRTNKRAFNETSPVTKRRLFNETSPFTVRREFIETSLLSTDWPNTWKSLLNETSLAT